MLRTAIVLGLGVSSLLLAAPLPLRKPEFGAGGSVSRAELEALPYAALADKVAGPHGLVGLGVALHLPRRRVREGEPIPAYFVVRNALARPAGLDMRLDLFDSTRFFNGCSVRVVRAADRKDMGYMSGRVISCGDRPLLSVPAGGHYCVRGSLDRGSEGPLPAGEYECSWSYDRLRSRAVTFTVLPGAAAPPVPPRTTRFFHVPPRAEEADPKTHLPASLLAGEVAAALALGVGGRHYPDVRDLPGRDEFVTAAAEWVRDAKGERLRVTLRAAPGVEAATFADVPSLYLQVEQPEEAGCRIGEARADAKRMMLDEKGYRTPLTLDVPLPKGWRREVAVPAGARVAVVVTAAPLELDRGARDVDRVQKCDPRGRGPWAGVVRTPFLEVGRER